MVSKCGVHILAIITLCLFIAAAKPAPCASCESSVSDLLKSSKTNRFFRVQVKEVLKVSGKVSLVKAQVTRVVRGPCIDAKEVAIRFSGDVGKPCPNLPTIRPGQVYGMPLTKPGGSIGGVPLYILRPCARHSLWSSYSTSEIQLLNKSSCKGGRPKKPAAPKRRPPSKDQQKQQIPRKTPRPASSYPDKIVMQAPPPPAAALSMPAPTSNPVPMVPKPNTQPKLPPGCPKMCSAGLLSQNNRECGPRPTRKDVTIKPSDNVKAIVEGAGPNKFIYLQPGVYRKGIDSIRPPSGTTLWAIPGTVTFEGGRKPAAITNADGQIDVTIYGIRFNGYAPLGEKGVINAPTNSIADKFDAKSDPLYGFAPGNDWVVDCCEFDRWWTTGARKGVAVKCGTGMVIRGNIFTNGHGNGIGCFARYVEIRGNRFEKLQLGGTYDQFHCAAIKLVSNKGSKVVNNFFEDIGCKAIWLDINCERGYVAHNHGVRIGTSFLHLEIGGAGTVVECNKVEGWGWRERMGPGVSTFSDRFGRFQGLHLNLPLLSS